MSAAGPVWLSGATGLVGGRLLRALRADGVALRTVTRRPRPEQTRPGVEVYGWDGRRADPATLDGCGAVVHLSGEPVLAGVPTAARRERMWTSRVESTRALVEALAGLDESRRPAVLACASAVGIYGDRGEEELTEESPPGEGFLADLCRAWEAEAAQAEGHGVRVVSLRIGVVLAREGGALGALAPLFRLGLGGPVGTGGQWFPWVHVDDLVALLRFVLDTPALRGPVNAVSPGVVRNAEFTRALGSVLGRPAFLRVPGFALRLTLGEIAGELLGSRRVVPRRALDAGFSFRYERIEDALAAERGA